MQEHYEIVKIEDYEKYIGSRSVDRILGKAEALRDIHVVHINSTYYGGGVAEILSSLSLLLNSSGIKAGWRVIQGSPDFFSVTKKIHNALQGGTSTSRRGRCRSTRTSSTKTRCGIISSTTSSWCTTRSLSR